MNARPLTQDPEPPAVDRGRLDPLDLAGIGEALARDAAARFGDGALVQAFEDGFFRAFDAVMPASPLPRESLAAASLAARGRGAEELARFERPLLFATIRPADVRADPYLRQSPAPRARGTMKPGYLAGHRDRTRSPSPRR